MKPDEVREILRLRQDVVRLQLCWQTAVDQINAKNKLLATKNETIEYLYQQSIELKIALIQVKKQGLTEESLERIESALQK